MDWLTWHSHPDIHLGTYWNPFEVFAKNFDDYAAPLVVTIVTDFFSEQAMTYTDARFHGDVVVAHEVTGDRGVAVRFKSVLMDPISIWAAYLLIDKPVRRVPHCYTALPTNRYAADTQSVID